MKKMYSVLICVILALALACPAFAAEQPNDLAAASAYLQSEGIMVGDQNGDMRLNDGLNRAEMATILARLHGGADVKAYQYMWACVYSDVPNWAVPYVGYCTAHLLVSGYGDGRYGASDPVIPAAACTVILRACGYADGEGREWSYGTACDYALSLGLIDQSTAKASVMTRGDMAVLIYRAMDPQTDTMPEKDVPEQEETDYVEEEETAPSPSVPEEGQDDPEGQTEKKAVEIVTPPDDSNMPSAPTDSGENAEVAPVSPENPSGEQEVVSNVPDGIVLDEDGNIISKTVMEEAWSREDFSLQANPEIFTGHYSRAWYNALRQSIVDREKILAGNNGSYFNPDYLYAHTLVPQKPDPAGEAFSHLLGRIGGLYRYNMGAEPYTINQYAYPGYAIMKVYPGWSSQSTLDFIRPKIESIAGMSDRKKVEALNDYLCELMEYDRTKTAIDSQIFTEHKEPVYGQCSSFANAFALLCGAADIPCVTVSSTDHAWNEVYVDGQWLVVDVASNDHSYSGDIYLLTTRAPGIDRMPAGTQFARELMVPGSTMK